MAGWQIGWLAGCEETKVCPFLIFFPLCIICRYLLDSQDQHVSLGGSALDRNLVNMDGILKNNRRNWLFEHFVEGASRSDVPITVVYTTEGGRAQAEDITMLTRKPVNV